MTGHALSSVGSRMWAVIALSAAVFGTAVVLAQAPVADSHHDAGVEHPQPADASMTGHQKMVADRKAMIARMATAEQKLEELVARMNAAPGEQKVSAIAAAVTELATQQRETDAQLLRMHSRMHEQMTLQMSGMHGAGGMMKKEK